MTLLSTPPHLGWLTQDKRRTLPPPTSTGPPQAGPWAHQATPPRASTSQLRTTGLSPLSGGHQNQDTPGNHQLCHHQVGEFTAFKWWFLQSLGLNGSFSPAGFTAFEAGLGEKTYSTDFRCVSRLFFKNRSIIYRITVVAGRTCQRKVSMTHQRETFELPPPTPRGWGASARSSRPGPGITQTTTSTSPSQTWWPPFPRLQSSIPFTFSWHPTTGFRTTWTGATWKGTLVTLTLNLCSKCRDRTFIGEEHTVRLDNFITIF